MKVFRYWIGASPEAPLKQAQDLATLHERFQMLGEQVQVEQFGFLGSMVMLKVEAASELALDFDMPATVVAFEHRHIANDEKQN
jgi:hypothetical protein